MRPPPGDAGPTDDAGDGGLRPDGGDGGRCAGRTLCATAGTSCDADTLVVCAADAQGCLVETRTGCGATGEVCDAPAGADAACVDPCSLLAPETVCTTDGERTCTGAILGVCAPDVDGCLVVTQTDCAATPDGICDASGAMPVCTVPVDPCAGLTICGTTTSRTCTDRGTLSVCAPNAFGCYVSTDTSCTATSEVCDTGTGTAICVDPCSLVTTCATATSCASNDLVTCTANADGCLVESSRTACLYTCDAASSPAACADPYCPEAQPAVLDCTSGTVTGTTVGGTTARASYCTAGSTSYSGAERIYRFRNSSTDRMAVTITATRTAASGDFDLFVWDGGDGTNLCTAGTITCLDSSVGSTATETVNFLGEPGQIEYVAYDIYNGAATTSDYTLAVTCTPIVCGDGILATGETCDDGNTTPSDGCSATCTVEAGFGCTGTPSVCTALCGNGVVNSGETCDDGNTTPSDGCSATCAVEAGFGCGGTPSVCIALAPNAVCSGATAITTSDNLTGEATVAGGPRPTGTGCGYGSGASTLYYAVTVPPMTNVNVVTTPAGGSDIVLAVEAACGAAACLAYTDSAPERTTLANSTGTAFTRIVAIRPYSSSTQATFDVAFTYVPFVCGNGIVEGTEACDDGAAVGADGCSATCAVEAGYVCTGAPSVCRLAAPAGFCETATAVTGTSTLTGQQSATGGPRPSGTGCGTNASNNTLYYSLQIPPNTRVVAQTASITGDIVLLTEDACGAAACTSRTDSAPERGTLLNDTSSSITRIVAVLPWSSSGVATWDITFTYVTFLCGNGILEGPETCDDGGVVAGDGCSATCAVESGYACVGAPSTCALASANAFCATAEAVTTTTSFTGESTAGGGARPTGTGCGYGSGARALWYSVTVPAGQQVAVQTTPLGSSDLVLFTQNTCAETTCVSSTDSAPESATFTNPGATSLTRLVGVRSYGAAVSTFDIAFTYSTIPAPATSITAACIDISTAPENTYTAAGIVGDDQTTAVAALPFSFSFLGATDTYWSMNTNGLLQLYPNAAGTPSTAYSNTAIPTASTPNGFIAPFWDDLVIDTLLGGGAGATRTATVGSGTSRVQVFEWRASHSGIDDLRFQVHLYETTNVIEIHYCSTGTGTGSDTGSSATVGIENGSGTLGVQTSYNTGGAAVTGTGYRYTP